MIGNCVLGLLRSLGRRLARFGEPRMTYTMHGMSTGDVAEALKRDQRRRRLLRGPH